ncbi:MAG: TnsA endonuclease N-terminal domain-containing protein [Marinosulfonomonas sp.]
MDLVGNSCDKRQQVRKIRPTRRSVSGVYAFRGEQAVPFESTLERDFLIRTEFFASVADVVSQPIQIPFNDQSGREYHYTPDFLVYRHLGNRTYHEYPRPQLIEVKPDSEWRKHWRKWLPKWKAARRLARENGWDFRIHDESRIRDQALENIRFLERFKRSDFPEEESRWVLETVEQMGSAPFHYLLTQHFQGNDRSVGVAHLWHLLAMRRLDCDINRKLGDFTELWICANEQ